MSSPFLRSTPRAGSPSWLRLGDEDEVAGAASCVRKVAVFVLKVVSDVPDLHPSRLQRLKQGGGYRFPVVADLIPVLALAIYESFITATRYLLCVLAAPLIPAHARVMVA